VLQLLTFGLVKLCLHRFWPGRLRLETIQPFLVEGMDRIAHVCGTQPRLTEVKQNPESLIFSIGSGVFFFFVGGENTFSKSNGLGEGAVAKKRSFAETPVPIFFHPKNAVYLLPLFCKSQNSNSGICIILLWMSYLTIVGYPRQGCPVMLNKIGLKPRDTPILLSGL
jgi:hypothetical protein